MPANRRLCQQERECSLMELLGPATQEAGLRDRRRHHARGHLPRWGQRGSEGGARADPRELCPECSEPGCALPRTTAASDGDGRKRPRAFGQERCGNQTQDGPGGGPGVTRIITREREKCLGKNTSGGKMTNESCRIPAQFSNAQKTWDPFHRKQR